MNIGNVNTMNYINAAYRAYLPTMPRTAQPTPTLANAPAGPITTRPVSPVATEPFTILPGMSVGRGHGSLLFYSLDGDSAEITRRAALEALEPNGACETCRNRKYVDQSDDASVSFQTPTKINPNMAGAAVASHEQEHVRNEQARAHREDREVTHQSVTLIYDFCPECGRHYVSGGVTRTTSVDRSDSGDEHGEDNSNTGKMN